MQYSLRSLIHVVPTADLNWKITSVCCPNNISSKTEGENCNVHFVQHTQMMHLLQFDHLVCCMHLTNEMSHSGQNNNNGTTEAETTFMSGSRIPKIGSNYILLFLVHQNSKESISPNAHLVQVTGGPLIFSANNLCKKCYLLTSCFKTQLSTKHKIEHPKLWTI